MAKPVTVVEFVAQAIQRSGKTQREIAEELGLPTPNFISMLKNGRSKIPPARVPELAKAIGVESLVLMRLVMEEDYPELWDTIRDCGHEPMTLTEADLVNRFRDATREEFNDGFDEVEMELLDAVFEQIARRRGIGR